MVFFGPIQIDATASHRLERALHSERSDIDVADDEGDEQDRNDAMHDLGELHARNVRDVEREQQQISRDRHEHAGAEREPEHRLLAGVETAGRRMLVGMKPPPSFSQTQSTLPGMLSFIHIATMIESPTTNGKLTKVWRPRW